MTLLKMMQVAITILLLPLMYIYTGVRIDVTSLAPKSIDPLHNSALSPSRFSLLSYCHFFTSVSQVDF